MAIEPETKTKGISAKQKCNFLKEFIEQYLTVVQFWIL
jgi:hypothetical protein